ncbi:MAG: hypothetical protein QOH98_418 [Methylobacteriaceae bacterium]|jgi:hypothetical protein|nr:hypothetical protein [Methylobacteriaceae bacterium]
MPEPTDYDTIAARYAAEIDAQPWNPPYGRPATHPMICPRDWRCFPPAYCRC